MSNSYIEVKNLKKYFQTPAGNLHAVDGLDFSIAKGKTIGVVGESGCGKSTTGRLMTMLLEPTEGEILFNGTDVTKLSHKGMAEYRKKIQIIFQDPFSSLNPRKTVFHSIVEPLDIHRVYRDKADKENRVYELMELVGLSERFVNSYPHELDGGRRQRIGIARALALSPEFIVCDEPVSALDVSIQAQILNLLKRLQLQFGYTYMFITHDLSVVKHFTEEIMVMYLGQVVEKAPVKQLFANPRHPYTRALLSAIPVPNLKKKKERILLQGEITSPINPKNECRFAARCSFATDECRSSTPEITDLGCGHTVRCFRVHELEEMRP
ncbi:ATP-binding cassette domain-containing protein [Brevibacillus centrosporus]|uniref:ABC transporter ATP-binding protein n=1 Tax=Brevibacillus centrosporus TaxID=54910 RepID=UPI000F0A536A|nr:oligopeptide/dipeptide ABC transporter ATP-binding protein [Brevibacillus centrosporus]MEC2130141.1 ATP-binding cassette domain-containing protein [Brevibacillus centrosporus]RNB65317.1 ATP-binding cassette domain-containing protein [Brevibacillus centrosporus]GED34600.1 ABC transporter ATP-binding protein [Brevibacillus centrosporus]